MSNFGLTKSRDLGSVYSQTGTALTDAYVAGTAQGAGGKRISLFVKVTKAAANSNMTGATVKLELLDVDANAYPCETVKNNDPDPANAAVEFTITAPSAGQSNYTTLSALIPPHDGWKVSVKLNATGVVNDAVVVKALLD
jgi:type IV pilus biogenesis protein CpaD/CtpE